jgi:hypothetical protein
MSYNKLCDVEVKSDANRKNCAMNDVSENNQDTNGNQLKDLPIYKVGYSSFDSRVVSELVLSMR